MKKRMLFIILMWIVGTATSGFSEIRPGAFSISPYIGGYTFEGNLDLKTRPVYGLGVGYYFTKNLGAELSFDYIRTKYTELANEVNTDVYNYRVEALYHFMPEKRLVPFVAAGVGGQTIDYRSDALDTRTRFVADYGAGLKYFVTESIALRADVRHAIAFGSAYNNLLYSVGVSFLFGGTKPAPVASPAPLAAPMNLSAKPVSDSEIDLDWDPVDGATGYKAYRDGAYVYPSKSVSSADKYLKPGTRYCYNVSATDDTGRESDLSNRACAETLAAMEEKKEPAAAPPVMEEKKQAPTAAQEMVEKGRATIDIQFDFNKSEVKQRYHDELKQFADVMKEHPDLKVVIEGHTDNVGGEAYNQRLSLRRAQSVRAYLIERFGIDESRLTAEGYGMSKPIADNKTAEGRQTNRRVEAAVDYTTTKK